MSSHSDGLRSEMHSTRVFLLLAIAGSMSTFAMDFFAPAMPNAMRGLGTSAEAMKTAVILFLFGYGISPFIWGPLADRLGRRRVIMIGLSLYALASVACMLAPSIEVLSVFRLLQGAGAACTAIVARSVLRDVHGAEGTTKAISRMFLVMVWFPITAPLVGGLMNSVFDWRAAFLVMTFASCAVLVACIAWLKETRPDHARSEAAETGPVREIFSHRTFLRYTMANMFSYTAMLYFLANYSFVTEKLYGLSPQQNGYVLTAFNAAVSAGFYFVWVAVPRLGADGSIRAGLWMAAIGWIGFLLASMVAHAAWAVILPTVLLACLGTGMVVSLTVGQALVPFPHAAGTASALFILVQSIGASVLNFVASQLFEVNQVVMASFLAGCAVFALTIAGLLGRR